MVDNFTSIDIMHDTRFRQLYDWGKWQLTPSIMSSVFGTTKLINSSQSKSKIDMFMKRLPKSISDIGG